MKTRWTACVKPIRRLRNLTKIGWIWATHQEKGCGTATFLHRFPWNVFFFFKKWHLFVDDCGHFPLLTNEAGTLWKNVGMVWKNDTIPLYQMQWLLHSTQISIEVCVLFANSEERGNRFCVYCSKPSNLAVCYTLSLSKDDIEVCSYVAFNSIVLHSKPYKAPISLYHYWNTLTVAA